MIRNFSIVRGDFKPLLEDSRKVIAKQSPFYGIAFGLDAIFPEGSDAKVNEAGDTSRGNEWVRLFL